MLTSLDRLELMGVTKLAVKEAGGQENAVNVTRITRGATFSDYANPQRPEMIPLDVAVEIDQFNGNARLVGKAADMLGCLVFRKPEIAPADTDEHGLLRVAKETTEAIATGWAARADGVVTPDERATELTQIDEAIVALLELRARWAMGES